MDLPNRRVVLEGELEGRSSAFPLNLLDAHFQRQCCRHSPRPLGNPNSSMSGELTGGHCQIEGTHQVSRTCSGNKLSTVILRFSRFWSCE